MGENIPLAGKVHHLQKIDIVFQDPIDAAIVPVLKTGIPLGKDPSQIVVIMIPQTQPYPGILPGGFTDILKIMVLSGKRYRKTVEIITQNIEFAEIFIQVMFPKIPAMYISNGQTHLYPPSAGDKPREEAIYRPIHGGKGFSGKPCLKVSILPPQLSRASEMTFRT
jgi:hypothetical protein